MAVHDVSPVEAVTETSELKADIPDDIILDLQIHLHNIAALGVAHLTDGIGVLQNACVPGIAEMVHDLLTVQSHIRCLL